MGFWLNESIMVCWTKLKYGIFFLWRLRMDQTFQYFEDKHWGCLYQVWGTSINHSLKWQQQSPSLQQHKYLIAFQIHQKIFGTWWVSYASSNSWCPPSPGLVKDFKGKGSDMGWEVGSESFAIKWPDFP